MRDLKTQLSTMLVIMAVSLAWADNAFARMYQWTSSATGRIQLSGSPPAWYRSHVPGPRVLVFADGVLVDDTAIVVSEAQRLEMRLAAMPHDAELHRQAQAIVPGRDHSTDDSNTRPAPLREIESAVSQESAAGSGTDKDEVEATVAELKALLAAWDAKRLKAAMTVLRAPSGTAPGTPSRAP